MILIADGGATKAEWVVIHPDHETKPVETSGFNPYFSDSHFIEEVVEKELAPFLEASKIREIYYYGAGCSTISKCNVVEHALIKEFPNAQVEVNHDLLGAARSLFGRTEGIACILGTGSNSCFYDGEDVVENVSSLGYLFGDEGSGAYLGKLFMRDLLKGDTPNTIHKSFMLEFGLNLENVLDAVYNKPHPNRFLASFALFIGQHMRSPYMREVVNRNFTDFFEEQVTRYHNYQSVPIGVIGSVGYHFRERLQKVAENYEVSITNIVQSPIGGLVNYHKQVNRRNI
jgi:N-acetylglucosamine kinase-like BadF-type ATPase